MSLCYDQNLTIVSNFGLNYLLQLDAFSCPSLKRSQRATGISLMEARANCARLEQQLADQILRHARDVAEKGNYIFKESSFPKLLSAMFQMHTRLLLTLVIKNKMLNYVGILLLLMSNGKYQ